MISVVFLHDSNGLFKSRHLDGTTLVSMVGLSKIWKANATHLICQQVKEEHLWSLLETWGEHMYRILHLEPYKMKNLTNNLWNYYLIYVHSIWF